MTKVMAVYDNGVFRPESSVDIEQGARVELTVAAPEESFEELRARLRRKFPNSLGAMTREQGEDILRAIDERFDTVPSP